MVPDHWSNDAMVSMDRCGLLEILILNHVSRVPSCEISGPDDSKNVEFIGSGIFRSVSYYRSKLIIRNHCGQ